MAADAETEEGVQIRGERTRSSQLTRFFSLESTGTDSFRYPNEPEERLPKLCGCNFILKLAQLFAGAVSLGLYSTVILIIPCDLLTKRDTVHSRITSLMFPNIVFTTFLIITGVITLSYVLRQTISEAVIRIFNVIGMVLYFVSASVSGYIWYKYLQVDSKEQNLIAFGGQIVTSLLNSVLYGLDVGLSIKKAWNINY